MPSHLAKTGLVTITSGKKAHLNSIDPDSTGDYKSKEEVADRLPYLVERLGKLQERLFAESKRSLLIVFQATDTGGKDGAISSLLTGVNPAGVQVNYFKQPSSADLAHDFLWRVHKETPPRGVIGVWNRSHYEDVLVTRVHRLVDKKVINQHYHDINGFERLLSDSGTRIIKFFLHISKEEQRKRLQARLDDPDKRWKFSTGDLTERKLWDSYQKAYEAMLQECSTEIAPWHVVPSNHKWARNIAIAECVVAALEEMNPRYPKISFDPDQITID